jgi:hypothetical protein
VLDVDAAAISRLPVGLIGRAEDLPPGTHVRIHGLPVGVTLSAGSIDGKHVWAVPLPALEDLTIEVPSGMSGNLNLIVDLVDHNGVVLDLRAAELRVTPSAPAAPRAAKATPARPIITAVLPSAEPPGVDQRRAVAGRTALHPAGTATAPPSSQRGANAPPLPRPNPLPLSRETAIRPAPAAEHMEPAPMASNYPNESRCLNDNRVPCNIGGGNGWWLWRALVDTAVGGRVGGNE